MRFTLALKWIRRLVRERHDVEAHNRYLVRMNANLTKANNRLTMSEATLRWRMEDLERAMTQIGTESD